MTGFSNPVRPGNVFICDSGNIRRAVRGALVSNKSIIYCLRFGRRSPGSVALRRSRPASPSERWTRRRGRPSIDSIGVRTMSGLTTHILDQAAGKPAAGVVERVSRREGEALSRIAELRTDADGRARLIAGE